MLRDILDIKNTVKREITLRWAPKHIGIQGNEMADRKKVRINLYNLCSIAAVVNN